MDAVAWTSCRRRRRSSSAKGILKSIETLHREGITAVKDPADRQPVWDAYRDSLREDKLTEHVCVLWYAGTHARLGARRRLRSISELPRPPRSLGDGTAAVLRRENIHGWQRRRAHRVGIRGMAQEFHRPRTWKLRLSFRRNLRSIVRWFVCFTRLECTSVLMRSATGPSIGWWTRTRRFWTKHPRVGLRHSIIHANIPSDHAHQDHGRTRKTLRRRLPGSASAFHVVDRRYLRRQFRTPTLTASDTPQYVP